MMIKTPLSPFSIRTIGHLPHNNATTQSHMSDSATPKPHLDGLDERDETLTAIFNGLMEQAGLTPKATPPSLERIETGWNNRVYVVNDAYALRLSKAANWPEFKITAEMEAGIAVDTIIRSTIPRPSILAADASGDLVPDGSMRSILMPKVEGRCLDTAWESMGLEAKTQLCAELADVVGILQSHAHSHGGVPYLDPSGELAVRERFDREVRGIPGTVTEWYRGYIDNHVAMCRENPYVEPLRAFIPRLMSVYESLELLDLDSGSHFVLVHGDLDLRNVMGFPETGALSAVLDWEWVWFAPIEAEFWTGFDELAEAGDTPLLQAAIQAHPTAIYAPTDVPDYQLRLHILDAAVGLIPWHMDTKTEEERASAIASASATVSHLLDTIEAAIAAKSSTKPNAGIEHRG